MRGEFCLHLGFGLQHRPLPRGRVRIPTFAASDRVADVCAKYAAHAGSDDDADSYVAPLSDSGIVGQMLDVFGSDSYGNAPMFETSF